MYSDHDPPHFHIIKDHWNIRVMFNLSYIKDKIIWKSKYPQDLPKSPLSANEEAELLKLIITHKKELNKQWQKLHPERKGLKKKKAEEGKDNGRSRKK